MTYYLLKITLSALLILLISEAAKRSVWLGGLFASIPLVSVLALIWLYEESHNPQTVARLATSIFWMVLPSLVLFLCLPELLKRYVPFYPALGLAIGLTVLAYGAVSLLLTRLGVRL